MHILMRFSMTAPWPEVNGWKGKSGAYETAKTSISQENPVRNTYILTTLR
jgi:hypothetical protein